LKGKLWQLALQIQSRTIPTYEDSEIIKVIMTGRLRWLGHLYRANETDPYRKVTFTKREGRRKKGKTSN
jgi:hypothetical protein